MIKWDIERLKEDSDAFYIADIIGLEKRRNGSTTFIPCLSGEHSETAYNHNQLFRNGCYCYTCNRRYNTYDMVQNYHTNVLGQSISLNDICEILAQSCGSRSAYILKSNGKQNGMEFCFPLNKEDLALIGLVTQSKHNYNRIIVGHSPEKVLEDKDKYTSWRGEYFKMKKVPQQTLMSLYSEEPDVCKSLMLQKAKEAIDDCEEQLTLFSGEDELSVVIRIAYQKKLAKVKDIYRRLGGVLPKKAKKIFHL